jgi:HAD superfamily hydrolase (TIGR01549 family)
MSNSDRPPRFPYVMFDLGSTLIYFDGEWSEVMPQAMQQATLKLRQLGYDLDSGTFPDAYYALIQEYSQRREDTFIEYSSDYVLQEALRAHSIPKPHPEHLRAAIKALYAVSQAHWHVEEDAAPMLDALRSRGCRMGIVSNASDDDDVQTLVDNAGLRGYFDFILSSAAAGVRKPDPKIFRQALAYWGALPEQAVMVGDTVNADIAGAIRSGIASVWISRRQDTSENRAATRDYPPGATITALSELPGLLDNWR